MTYDACGGRGLVKCMRPPVWRFRDFTEHCDEHGPEWPPMVALLQTADWKAALAGRQLDLFGEVGPGALGWERL